VKNKYIVLLGDGMADLPIDKLGGKTPLEYAKTDNMDFIAQNGQIGMVQTIPDGFPPGSDVANMAIIGYEPEKYYTGRAPLEVVNLGITLAEGQLAFRLNFVTLSGSISKPDSIMEDFSGGHISSEEAASLISALQEELGDSTFSFHPGVSYRNIMLWNGGENERELVDMNCTPPHDISGQSVGSHLPNGALREQFIGLVVRAEKVLAEHPVNLARKEAGKAQATSIWLWGQGKASNMPSFKDKFGLTGNIISAVDLINGIGRAVGLKPVKVEGATGYIDTNYEGKALAALAALRENDFVFLHVEAPDEAGHNGSLADKLQAIEDFDAKIVAPILEAQKSGVKLRILVLCDHATPVALKTHTDVPVPFILYPAIEDGMTAKGYSENCAESEAMKVCRLMPYFLGLE